MHHERFPWQRPEPAPLPRSMDGVPSLHPCGKLSLLDETS